MFVVSNNENSLVTIAVGTFSMSTSKKYMLYRYPLVSVLASLKVKVSASIIVGTSLQNTVLFKYNKLLFYKCRSAGSVTHRLSCLVVE